LPITKHTVATLEYTLRDGDGEVIDTTEGGTPLIYVHGTGSLIPGLELALEGKGPGDEVSVKIAPEDAYGERDDELIHSVERAALPQDEELELGMTLEAESEQGVQIVTVVGFEKDDVLLDGNHPLAGVTLHFEVKVIDTRPASPEEIAHGHVHGEGGHAH
jgi:FKBP-type peptidyl-prolyl cis-trans isomerase SlyD